VSEFVSECGPTQFLKFSNMGGRGGFRATSRNDRKQRGLAFGTLVSAGFCVVGTRDSNPGENRIFPRKTGTWPRMCPIAGCQLLWASGQLARHAPAPIAGARRPVWRDRSEVPGTGASEQESRRTPVARREGRRRRRGARQRRAPRLSGRHGREARGLRPVPVSSGLLPAFERGVVEARRPRRPEWPSAPGRAAT
jgi:hypothetical protein